MNERVKRLRQATMSAQPSISAERALLMSRFLESGVAKDDPVPVQRARTFAYVLENKDIHIGAEELIVGERGPAPAVVPTYPELCLHTPQDLETLDSRNKIPYAVDEEVEQVYREKVRPVWQGRTQRERIFAEMSEKWKQVYEAGIFTEFQEQRAPGHTVLGRHMFHKGFLDLKQEICRVADEKGWNDELRAMKIAASAIIRYAERHADKLDSLAETCADDHRRRELRKMAAVCRRVPAYVPRTFHEALQHYWFIHLGVTIETNPWDSFNPGRLDVNLYPFYKHDIAKGLLTTEQAKELLEFFWVKFHNHPAPPKVGVTARESGTYTDFCLINVGGVNPDGSDAVNELSYLILDVIDEMRMVMPSSMAQVSKKNPNRFVKAVVDVIRNGAGQPSVFNTEAIIAELLRQGKSLEDARNGGASGCVESGAFGKEAYILTGYFNLPKVLELTLHNGCDPRTGKQIGPITGDPVDFQSFEELFSAFQAQIKHFVDIKIAGNNVIDRLYAQHLPVPFLSLLIDDCIDRRMDYHTGGARYNTSYIQGVGIGSVTDSLSSINHNVYEKRRLTIKQLLEALDSNFAQAERLRKLCLEETPKYGNDDDRADRLMRLTFQSYCDAVDGRPNARGGAHRINMLPTTCHIYFGEVVGATPDGRLAGEPLSEGISPVQGADRHGPTAVMKSASKMDHLRTGGTLLNQKFTPRLLRDAGGVEKLAQLIRGYFRLDGHHVQFNLVTAETLRDAKEHPEKHRDLIVRVAGYSDYFINLNEGLQNDIISRTEHMEF